MDPEKRDRNLLMLGGLGSAGAIGYGLGVLHMKDSDEKPWIDAWRKAERDKYGTVKKGTGLFTDDKPKLDELEDIFKPNTKKSPWR